MKFNQNAWLKLYIDMKKSIYWSKKKSKKWLWKIFFKLMNNAVFRKTMEPNYHITKCFTGYLLAIGMKKKKKNTYQ